MGLSGHETSKIGCLSINSIASKAASLLNTTTTPNNDNKQHLFMPLVNISCITINESKDVSLCATTQHGIRLYFSISEFENQLFLLQQQQQLQLQLASQQQQQQVDPNVIYQQQQQLNQQQQQQQQQQQDQFSTPSTFQLVHIRLPPTFALNQVQSLQISSAYASQGVSLMISSKRENDLHQHQQEQQSDSVMLLNRDLFLLHNAFKESKFFFDLNTRVWHVEEIQPSLGSIRAAAMENDILQTAKSASNLEQIPKLCAEYFELPRRFAMITPQGCFIWSKLRPIDQLTLILREGNGPNSDGVKLFFNKIYEVINLLFYFCLKVFFIYFLIKFLE